MGELAAASSKPASKMRWRMAIVPVTRSAAVLLAVTG
jgi:hypothetical protein